MAIVWVWGISLARTFCLEIALICLLIPAAALALRRRMLAAVGVGIAAMWAWPGWELLRTPMPEELAGSPIVCMSFNVLGLNRNHAGILEEIVQADPDVLAIQEYTLALHEAIGPDLLQRWPHVQLTWWNERFGMALYSRIPFDDARTLRSGDRGRTMLRVTLAHSEGPLVCYAIHPAHPAGVQLVADGRMAFRHLLDAIDQETHPVVILGDFNASLWSPQDESLRRRGYRNTLSLAARGYQATWPAAGPMTHVPSVRIDHIYVSPGLLCDRATTGSNRGSDHRPVIARIGRGRSG
ncbi:MAG: endonuclease/exonuclease/phosphatase family protein [Phycisphaeraceae bacterium]|nr:endonuclease/exonuclease/phosphatase family protein [Phycisphaeraceae bacterium]MCW5753561.1 endonuclease/exonuclease/phosphatase family protein [Phycisphaeraceae bacterium]